MFFLLLNYFFVPKVNFVQNFEAGSEKRYIWILITCLLGQPLLCNSSVFADFFTDGDKRLDLEAIGGGGGGQRHRVDLDSLGLSSTGSIITQPASTSDLGITVTHDLRDRPQFCPDIHANQNLIRVMVTQKN